MHRCWGNISVLPLEPAKVSHAAMIRKFRGDENTPDEGDRDQIEHMQIVAKALAPRLFVEIVMAASV